MIYEKEQVEDMLKNYAEIRSYVMGRSRSMESSTMYVNTHNAQSKERTPLGHKDDSNTSWPFMEPKRAKKAKDGKRAANLIEQIHVCLMDLECGFEKLNERDKHLLMRSFIDDVTYADIAKETGETHVSTIHYRTHKAVDQLVEFMNGNAVNVNAAC